MNEWMRLLFSLSFKASWAVPAVLLLRVLLKKAPKWTHCLLWAVVAVRLILPFSLESVMSLVPRKETVETLVRSGQLYNLAQPEVQAFPEKMNGNIWLIVWAVWFVGVLGILFYAGFTYFKMYRRISVSVLGEQGVYLCDDITGPFIFGMVKPRICLPSGMPEKQIEYVVRHESTHLKRKDHWWKPLGFVLVTMHWFNPVLWFAYKLFSGDVEHACDEAVISGLNFEERKAYSETLLTCGMERRMRVFCPVAFGETGVQERVVSILSYRKQAFWRTAVAAAMCVLLAVCFLSDPVTASVMMNEDPAEIETESLSSTEMNINTVASGNRIVRGSAGKLIFDSEAREYVAVSEYDFSPENYVDVIANGISVSKLKCCPEMQSAGMEISYSMAQNGGENAICPYISGIHIHHTGSIYAVGRCKNCGSDLGAYYVGEGYYCEYAEQVVKE